MLHPFVDGVLELGHVGGDGLQELAQGSRVQLLGGGENGEVAVIGAERVLHGGPERVRIGVDLAQELDGIGPARGVVEPEPGEAGIPGAGLLVFQGAENRGGLELLAQLTLLGLLLEGLRIDAFSLFLDIVLQAARLFGGVPARVRGRLGLTGA